MALIEIKVPDIGDFDEVAVIELLVKAGDVVKPEQSLLTVESDKASMEIPCSHAGVVKELKVKLGHKVKQGSVILLLEGEAIASEVATPISLPAAQASAPVAAASAAPAALNMPNAVSYSGSVDIECDLLVLGAGPGGRDDARKADATTPNR